MSAYIRIFEDKWKAIHSIKAIKKTERERLAAALLDYGCLGIEPAGLSNIAQGMFDAIKTSLAPSGRGAPEGNQNARKNKSETNQETIIENNSENNSQNNSEKNKKNNSVQNTEYRIQNTETDTPLPPKGNCSAAFEKFWQAYPKSRRVGKQKALKIFDKALKANLTTLDAILDKLEQLKRSEQWTKDNGAYIPHPTTWLNRGGWDDEVDDIAITEKPWKPVPIVTECPDCGSHDLGKTLDRVMCRTCGAIYDYNHTSERWEKC